MSAPFVLIIDDEERLVASLVYGLKAHGIQAEGAFTGESGLAALVKSTPDIVLLDLRLPDMSGLDLLSQIKARHGDVPVVMISAHGDIKVAVEAVKKGAENFITKPFELDELIHVIRKTIRGDHLAHEIAYRRQQVVEEHGGLVGDSAAMATLRQLIDLVALSAARTILLLGESGTGKGLVARCLHAVSARAKGPFVGVNCASLPAELLEAELFGAERGAYTGAYQKRVGLVELAEGGSLFLDEVGELTMGLQAKLLRFLESYSYRPIGGNRERNADVRVIAATNRDIEDEVKEGRFRSDLYYRLNVVPIKIPRLADRPEDIVPLARYFAQRQSEAEGCAPIQFSADACASLLRYTWPGNVRELKNLVERLTILYPGAAIAPLHLPTEIQTGDSEAPRGIASQLMNTERDILLRALRDADGHKGKAAESLGISRHAFKRRLQKLQLD